jgi:hypothetical protein
MNGKELKLVYAALDSLERALCCFRNRTAREEKKRLDAGENDIYNALNAGVASCIEALELHEKEMEYYCSLKESNLI